MCGDCWEMDERPDAPWLAICAKCLGVVELQYDWVAGEWE